MLDPPPSVTDAAAWAWAVLLVPEGQLELRGGRVGVQEAWCCPALGVAGGSLDLGSE